MPRISRKKTIKRFCFFIQRKIVGYIMFCFFVVVVFLGVFFILSFWPVKSGLHQRSYERLLQSVFVKLLVFVYVLVIIEILQNSY